VFFPPKRQSLYTTFLVAGNARKVHGKLLPAGRFCGKIEKMDGGRGLKSDNMAALAARKESGWAMFLLQAM
jgi:hypothetical protein